MKSTVREVLAVGILLVVCGLGIFYKLGQSSLYSFDEAWYGEVAKQFLHKPNIWVMHFNNQIFTDHPPVGFWVIAIGQMVFGVNEIGTRIGPAVWGILGLLGTYLLGKVLFSKKVGWLAAFSLFTAPWYLYRARSGNLDVILTAGIVWLIYFAWKAKDDKRYFIPLIVISALVMLIKTAVPFTVFPAIVLIFWGSKIYSRREKVIGLATVLCVYGIWIQQNVLESSIFTQRYLTIGFPGIGQKSSLISNILQIKTFVHNGIGRWFRVGVLALTLCGLQLKKKNYLVSVFVVGGILFPMVFSDRARLWHMIPVYPFLLLALFGVMNGLLTRWKLLRTFLLVGFALYIGVPQIKANWWEFVDIPAFVSDEAILSKKAGELTGKLYIGENFLPAAVFYADKHVERMYGSVDELYQVADSNYLVIAKQIQLDEITSAVTKYEEIAKDRDKVLIKFKKF